MGVLTCAIGLNRIHMGVLMLRLGPQAPLPFKVSSSLSPPAPPPTAFGGFAARNRWSAAKRHTRRKRRPRCKPCRGHLAESGALADEVNLWGAPRRRGLDPRSVPSKPRILESLGPPALE